MGATKFSAVRFSATGSEDIIGFKWFQVGAGGVFYIKLFEDDGGMPGDEIGSTLQPGGFDGWNYRVLIPTSISGDFWMGVKEFSSSLPFGLDTDSNSGNSYQNTGDGWTSIEGNLGYHVYLDCGDNCNDCPSAGSGDITDDGNVDVLDIVLLVNVILSK